MGAETTTETKYANKNWQEHLKTVISWFDSEGADLRPLQGFKFRYARIQWLNFKDFVYCHDNSENIYVYRTSQQLEIVENKWIFLMKFRIKAFKNYVEISKFEYRGKNVQYFDIFICFMSNSVYRTSWGVILEKQ